MAKSEKFKRLEAIDEIDFLCHDDTDTLFERQLVKDRLREFDPDDLEFILELCDAAYTQGKNLNK